MSAASISESLERLADQSGDITGAVYARLFSDRPEAAALFLDDGSRNARGSMLSEVIVRLLSLEEGDATAAALIRTDISRHVTDFHCEPELFGSFFGVLADTVRELLGPSFTEADKRAWEAVLEKTARLVPR